jgi:hypothetical protein
MTRTVPWGAGGAPPPPPPPPPGRGGGGGGGGGPQLGGRQAAPPPVGAGVGCRALEVGGCRRDSARRRDGARLRPDVELQPAGGVVREFPELPLTGGGPEPTVIEWLIS